MHAQNILSSTDAPTPADRKFCRGDVAIDASIRAFGGTKSRVKVLDISMAGFRMECLTYLSDSQIIFLTLPNFQQMEAAIIWQTEWMYGCQFARPLHIGVFEHIIRTFPALVGPSNQTDGLVYGAAAGLQWRHHIAEPG